MPYVYSTATAGTEYAFYRSGGAELPVFDGSVKIAGGANVTNKNFITPLGVVTKVTDEELARLKEHPEFIRHMNAGFVSFRDDKVDVEVAAADMASRDPSAPLVDADFHEGKEPVVGFTDDDEVVAKKKGRRS